MCDDTTVRIFSQEPVGGEVMESRARYVGGVDQATVALQRSKRVKRKGRSLKLAIRPPSASKAVGRGRGNRQLEIGNWKCRCAPNRILRRKADAPPAQNRSEICAPKGIRTPVTGLKRLQGLKITADTSILERFAACYRGRLLAVVLAVQRLQHFQGIVT